MAMSSYIVNSKYVDPKFPPCEEYSQTSYIPDQGTEYYSPSQDTDFQHPGIYSRSNYTEQTFSCNTVQGSTVQPRGHVQEQTSQLSPFTAQTEPCPPVQMSGPRTCGQQQNSKSQNGIQAKQPAIVYPWMKKVHVTTVNTDYTGSEPKRSRTAYTRQQHLNKWKLGRDGHHEQVVNEEIKKHINVENSLELRNGWETPIT
ncbi:hypothetical protein COCON_G00049340 [Conger conger]|uniref:Uncharacterized protein n=1 Tax=Conger conger TaxID=82655 RepID=A0A9Q1DV57_CONCO|nr:hypothetical protein COCON_G00049340 [Conger conger]